MSLEPSSSPPATLAATSPASGWAWASFGSGLAGLLFSFTTPIPFIPTPCFIFPLGLTAFAAGWVARRRAHSIGDDMSRRRATWGMAFGCVGWLIYFAVFAFTIGAIGALFAAWWQSQR